MGKKPRIEGYSLKPPPGMGMRGKCPRLEEYHIHAVGAHGLGTSEPVAGDILPQELGIEVLSRVRETEDADLNDSSHNQQRPDFAIVCCCAMYGDESNFAEITKAFKKVSRVRFVFVTPPYRDEWYRYFGHPLAWRHHQDCQEIDKEEFVGSSKILQEEIIKQASQLGGFDKVFLLSYSQGGTIAMDAAMNLDEAVGGVILLRATVMQLSFQRFKERVRAPMQFPIIVIGAMKAGYTYTMQETDRIFEQMLEQGWNVRYHVFFVAHGDAWSKEELRYVNWHLCRWMSKTSTSALFSHDIHDRGEAWVRRPKHTQDQASCPVCNKKRKPEDD